MQVSRTPRTKFMWCAVVRGVGEALKREIAGMVLVGQPGLWGFEDGCCFGFGWERCPRAARVFKSNMYFADFLTIFFASRRFEQLLRHRFMDLRRSAVPRAVWREAEVGIGGVTCHAAALVVSGGALGCRSGAKASMMISRPPQHGQGNARIRGCSLAPSAGSPSL